MEAPGALTGRLFYYLKKIMSKLEKVLLSLSLVCTVFALGFMFLSNTPHVEGSVAIGNSYHSTTTTNAFNGTVAVANGANLAQCGNATCSGDLGTVIITGANTGTINIYDGTTTKAHSDSATTTLASFPASTVAGTYTFDTQYYKGLIIETIGTVATTTITYR